MHSWLATLQRAAGQVAGAATVSAVHDLTPCHPQVNFQTSSVDAAAAAATLVAAAMLVAPAGCIVAATAAVVTAPANCEVVVAY